MKEEQFNKWLNAVKNLMVITGIASPEIKLCPDGYRPYYNNGKSAYNTLREEFGKDWAKAYQKYYYSTLNQ